MLVKPPHLLHFYQWWLTSLANELTLALLKLGENDSAWRWLSCLRRSGGPLSEKVYLAMAHFYADCGSSEGLRVNVRTQIRASVLSWADSLSCIWPSTRIPFYVPDCNKMKLSQAIPKEIERIHRPTRPRPPPSTMMNRRRY